MKNIRVNVLEGNRVGRVEVETCPRDPIGVFVTFSDLAVS